MSQADGQSQNSTSLAMNISGLRSRMTVQWRNCKNELPMAATAKAVSLGVDFEGSDGQGYWEATRIPKKGEDIGREAVTSWAHPRHSLRGLEAVGRVWWCLPTRRREAEIPVRTGKLTCRAPEKVKSPWYPSRQDTWVGSKHTAYTYSQKKTKIKEQRPGALSQYDTCIITAPC